MDNFINKLLNKSGALGKLLDKLGLANALDKLRLVKLDTRQAVLAASACLVIIFCMDIAFPVKWQLKALRELAPKIIKIRQDLSRVDKGLLIMWDLKNKQDETLSKGKKIVSEGQIDYILQDLSAIAKQDNVNITQMRPLRQAPPPSQAKAIAAPAPRFTSLLINLDLLCDYHHFGKFISDLENAEVFYGVEAIAIRRQENNYLQQKVNLVLKTYVKK